jgi:Protein of unknown function (DUF992)
MNQLALVHPYGDNSGVVVALMAQHQSNEFALRGMRATGAEHRLPEPSQGNPQTFWALLPILGGRPMTQLLLAGVAIALAAGVSAQANRTNLGALTCTLSEVAEQPKAPAAEERAMRCAFKPINEGVELTYSGTIRQIGQGQLPGASWS